MVNKIDETKVRFDYLLTILNTRTAKMNEILNSWNSYSSMLLQFQDWCIATTKTVNAISLFPDFIQDFSTVLETLEVITFY